MLIQFRMGKRGEGRAKGFPYSFSPVTSTDVGISHQNFQTFLVLIFLPYCCKIARPYLVPVPNY